MLHISQCAERPISTFMEEYLPGPDDNTPGPHTNSGDSESRQHIVDSSDIRGDLKSACAQLRESFNCTLRSSSSDTAESFAFYETRQHTQLGLKRLKIDICMYSQTEQAVASYHLKKSLSTTKAHTVFSRIELPVFVELDWKRSPFTFDHRTVAFTDTELGERNRTRLARCIGEIQLSQHRQFVFAIWIQRDRMRLMRWDRSGAIFSSAVNYVEDPLPLLEFLRRFACATPAQRGHDPSVSLATAAEIEMLLNYEPKNKWERAYYAEMTQNLDHYPIRKVTCESVKYDDSSLEQSYLIGRHRYGEHEPIGRGTRCYVAYDIAERRLAFLKDFWYTPQPILRSELNVYELLMEAGVRNIAVAIAGGHVGEEYIQCTEPPRRSSVRYHDRVVFETVGRPLESHKDQRELICVVRDALVAHSDAYHRAGILHADISPANILIDVHTGKGFLNDWHLCRRTDAVPDAEDQDTRVGTWATMSARLVLNPYKQNDLADDLESFLHTLALIRLRFYPHNMSPRRVPHVRNGRCVDVTLNAHNMRLSSHLNSIYYTCASSYDGGPVYGDLGKESCVAAAKDLVGMPACPLANLLHRLYQLCSQSYRAIGDDANTIPEDLRDHRAMLHIFDELAQSTDCSVGKTKDQFENLCAPLGRPYPQSPWDIGRQRTRPIPLFDE